MIHVEQLVKRFGQVRAVDGVSFQIEQGEFYGFLGPNGAGKSTTLNILSTLLAPDSGHASIGGLDITRHKSQVKSVFGYVSQEIALYDELTAEQNLLFWGSLYRLTGRQAKQRAEQLLRTLGLYDRRGQKLKHFSGGMKRRVNLAAALLHEPKVLFLDEPTVGIDPQSRNLVYDVLRQLNQQEGITMLYTTHYLQEAEDFCSRISIMDLGRIVAEGTLEELKAQSKIREAIILHVPDALACAAKLEPHYPRRVQVADGRLFLEAEQAKQELPRLTNLCFNIGIEIQQIELQKANLENIFLHHTGKQLRDF